MNLAKILIERPVYAWMVILLTLIGGIVGYINISRLEDPNFTIKTALVVTLYPGASAIEVEQEVSDRIESAIQQMAQVDRIESYSEPGYSEIRVIIRDQYNSSELPQIWDELRNRVGDAAPLLPPGAGPSRVIDTFGDVYGIFYALSGSGYSPAQLYEYARELRRQLLKLDDIADVTIGGVQQEQITIEIDEAALVANNLSLTQIAQALNAQNEVRFSGQELAGGTLLRITPSGALDSVEAIRSLPLNIGTGNFVLGDIAKVEREYAPIPRQIIRLDGQPALTIGISARANTNVVNVGQEVDELLERLALQVPTGIQLTSLYDQPHIVNKSVQSFIINVVISVMIVAVILCFGLGWRAGTVLAIELFLSITGTIAVMYAAGIELERISLGALIIVMGMLTDNTIVVCEGMLVRVTKGMSHIDAATQILNKSKWILLASTIVGILAFSGIGLSPDAIGEFCASLFQVAAISLLMSWVIAVLLTPLLGKYFLRQPSSDEKPAAPGFAYQKYAQLLKWAVIRRKLVLVFLAFITIISIWAFRFVPQSFFPPSETPMFYVDMHMPRGTDVRTVSEKARDIENLLGDLPEVEHVTSLIGAGATRFVLVYDPHSPDSAYAQFIVQVQDSQDIEDMLPQIRETLEQEHPYARWVFIRPTFGPSGGATLQARFSGEDPAILRQLSEQAQEIFRNHDQVISTSDDWERFINSLRPEFDEDHARTVGVTRRQVSDTLMYATDGIRIGTYREEDLLHPIVVRAPLSAQGVERLADLQIYSEGLRQYIPLSSVVNELSLIPEEGRIIRRQRERVITVNASPREDVNSMAVFNQIRPLIEAIPLPVGYKLEWGGEYEASSDAQESLFRQLPLSFIAMIVLVFLMFGRAKPALIVLLVVPMSICGVTIGLLTFNGSFGFVALLGLLSLIGMLIKNAVMVVEEIDEQILLGIPSSQAVIEGAASRLRPVFLAAITTTLGMIPLLWDSFFSDMAITMMAGLLFATILTLVAVPALYALFFSIDMEQ